MSMRTCGDADRYCKSIYDQERYKNVKLCSKCKEQIDDKKSYCKSIYDSETKDLILKK